jgi:hypothetical protein
LRAIYEKGSPKKTDNLSGTFVLVRHVKEGISFARDSQRDANPIREYVTYPQARSK